MTEMTSAPGNEYPTTVRRRKQHPLLAALALCSIVPLLLGVSLIGPKTPPADQLEQLDEAVSLIEAADKRFQIAERNYRAADRNIEAAERLSRTAMSVARGSGAAPATPDDPMIVPDGPGGTGPRVIKITAGNSAQAGEAAIRPVVLSAQQ